MIESFNPSTGELTDMTLPVPESERIADLFAGAIVTFKNPRSQYGSGAHDRGTTVCE